MFLKISKFILYLVPLSVVIVYQGTLFPFIVGKYVFFRTMIDLALIFYVLYWASDSEVKIKNKLITHDFRFTTLWKKPLITIMVLFSFIFVLSGFFGVNAQGSFWSNFERGEGGLQMVHLIIYFILLGFVFKDKDSWHKLFVVFIWSGVAVIFYGIMAALGIGSFFGPVGFCQRFSGSLGNPAYTGTFLLFMIFFAGYLLNNDWKNSKKWLWIILLVLFVVFLLLTQTRGALLGLGAAIIAGLIYYFFSVPKGKVKNYTLLAIIFIVIGSGTAVKYRNHIDLMPFCGDQGGNRIIDISFQAESYKTRLLLWKQSFEAFKERPILGWGPENFTTAFEKYYDTRHYNSDLRLNKSSRYSQVWYDRAHNIFFDYLIFSGILGLLSFLSIFGIYYWQFSKFNKQSIINSHQKNNKNKSSGVDQQLLVSNALLFSLPIAYLVQGLVLFDVLSIYINLFLFLAFANWKFSNK